METTKYKRVQSGDYCTASGWYEFDGYVAGPPEPLPHLTEWEILLGTGDVFPSIQNPHRACYWKAVVGAEHPADADVDQRHVGSPPTARKA